MDVLIYLPHYSVDLVSQAVLKSERYVLMLEFCRHFFLHEFQFVIDEFYLFGDSEWKSRPHLFIIVLVASIGSAI